MSKNWQIAQMNVATALFPLEDPRIAEFVDNLDKINELAEKSQGFVWRLKDDAGDATNIKVSDDPKFIVNMSVWEDVDSLFDYVYKSDHTAFIGKRMAWFEKPTQPIMVLWWVPFGHQPTAEEGMARLEKLRANGPTVDAFNFKNQFTAPIAAA